MTHVIGGSARANQHRNMTTRSRDPIKTATPGFWRRALSMRRTRLADQCKSLEESDNPASRAKWTDLIITDRFETLLARYSAGEPVAVIAAEARVLFGGDFPAYMAAFPPRPQSGARRPCQSDLLRRAALLILSRPTAAEAAAFVAAARLWDRTTTPTVVDCKGDRVLAAVLAALDLAAPQPRGRKVVWPEAYRTLWTALDPVTAQENRLPALQGFLEAWYPQMEGQGTGQSGRQQKGNLSFVGYWCLEAAAAVMIKGLDDTSLRDHPHYPGDLVTFARGVAVRR